MSGRLFNDASGRPFGAPQHEGRASAGTHPRAAAARSPQAADRAAALKRRVGFARAAEELGLNPVPLGKGWMRCDCPACGRRRGVAFAEDAPDAPAAGGRCKGADCGKGYDTIALVRETEGLSFAAALAYLEDIADSDDARAAESGADDLLSQGLPRRSGGAAKAGGDENA